jgi:predicted nucleic-acid-binding Zn-ribbon protein
MKKGPCPKCGSPDRDQGKIYKAGNASDVRFKSDAAPFLSNKKGIIALACPKCGFIELYLSDRDYGDAA